MLHQIYKRAIRAGGSAMPIAKYAKVFGNDTVLRRNVLRACDDLRYGAAIEAGTVGDHRVFEALNRMGKHAAHLVLDLEAKLGRRLGRAKAQQLCGAYLRIVAKRAAQRAAKMGDRSEARPVLRLQRVA